MRLDTMVSLPAVGRIAMAGFALRTTVASSVSFDLAMLTMVLGIVRISKFHSQQLPVVVFEKT